jgi:hypothetical protein
MDFQRHIMKTASILFFLISTFFFLNCSLTFGSATPYTDDYYRNTIVGTWIIADSDSTPSETTYTRDGRVFYKTLTPDTLEAVARWKIKNGSLLVKVTQSSDETIIPVGTITVDRIVDLTAEKQVLICDNNKRVIRIKKP